MLKYIMCKSVLVGVGLFSLLTSGNAYSTTYYTALTGSDNYTCVQAASQSTPKQTIHAGAACLQAGDTLLVRAGTYAEEFTGNDIPSGTSWSSPVTIAAYSGETVTIRPSSGATRVFTFLDPQQYIVIDRFILDGVNVGYDVIKITCGGACTSNANHIRIQNSEVMHATYQGILTGGDWNEFKNLKVHDNGNNCFGVGLCHGFYIDSANNLIDHCEVYNNTGIGVQLYDGSTGVGAHDNIVRNNIIHDNGSSRDANAGITLTSGAGNIAYNNIVWNSKVGIQLDYGAVNTQVYNNTVYGNTIGGIYNGAGSANAVIRNNIVYNNASTIQDISGSATIDHNLTTNPLFVNAASADFHLQTGSPTIDAGITIPLISTDIAGTSRPQGQGYDIGAYEYVSNSTRIAAPVLYIR